MAVLPNYWQNNRFMMPPTVLPGVFHPAVTQQSQPAIQDTQRYTGGGLLSPSMGGDGSVPGLGGFGNPTVTGAETGGRGSVTDLGGVQGPVVGPAQDVSDALTGMGGRGLGLLGSAIGGPVGAAISIGLGLGNIAAQSALAPPGQFGVMDAISAGFGAQPVSNTLSIMANDPMGNYGAEQDAAPATNSQGANATSTGVNTGGNEGLDGNGGDGGGSTKMICTELHRQGFLPDDVFSADCDFGKRLAKDDPAAMAGYHLWATPIVRLMRRSAIATRIILFLATPWARHISGDENVRGWVMLNAGVPLCRAVWTLKQAFSRREKPAT